MVRRTQAQRRAAKRQQVSTFDDAVAALDPGVDEPQLSGAEQEMQATRVAAVSPEVAATTSYPRSRDNSTGVPHPLRFGKRYAEVTFKWTCRYGQN